MTSKTCLRCGGCSTAVETACTCPEGPAYEIHEAIRNVPKPLDPTSSPLRGEEFVKDWNRMVASVAEFSTKWNLPKAEMLLHPQIHSIMNLVAHERILGTLIHMGVKVRFGRFEQGTIFREH